MDTRQAYNQWAQQYDTDRNRTRDLEARALRELLAPLAAGLCLELGCGTGKNTEWLQTRARHVTAVDLSESMLARAREKVAGDRVRLVQADLNEDWRFAEGPYDLATFSLVLEHLRDLDPIFDQVARHLLPGGLVYVGELHPFKQYSGSKARFENAEGLHIVPCFNHHVSDFTESAKRAGLRLLELREYFDEDDRTAIPRILCLLFRKEGADALAEETR